MTIRVEGEVFKVYSKDFRGKTNYTIKIDNDPIWYRCGTSRYAGVAESGNKITFEAEMNPDGSSATVKTAPTLVVPAPPTAAAPVAAAGGGDRQSSISYQSSRKDALQFLELALTNGAIVLPAAKAKKLGALEAALDRYTAQFFEDIATLGAITREAEEVSDGGEEGEGEDDDE